MANTIIIGAGISGLATAYRLSQRRPHDTITLLETRERPGGCIWTLRRDGFQVEAGPNGFLDNKPTTLGLARDLSLAEQLLPASESSGRNRYLFLNGRLQALPAGLWPFITSPLLSWRGKLALLTEPLRPRRRGHDDESVADFARRRAGREAAEVFADALVTGIHGGDPELLSARSAFPRLTEMEREHGSVVGGMRATSRQKRAEAAARGEPPPGRPRMWSFAGGLRVLVERLVERLPRPPEYGVNVTGVTAVGREWQVAIEGQGTRRADALVLACPAYAQARLLGDRDPALTTALSAIPYNRIAVVAVGFAKKDVPGDYDGFGYIAPQRTRRDLLGVQWCSAIFPERAPPGMVLWRALCGGWHRTDVMDWSDDRLVEAVCSEMRLACGVRAAPMFREVVRWDRAIPQYQIGHADRVATIEARTATQPGLFLTGNSFRGVAINDCCEDAEKVAGAVAAYLGGRAEE